MASTVLSVSHLSTVFDRPSGPAVAVDDVSFEIGAGETLGLVGESGSGKSLTALSLIRLVPHPGRIAAGSIQLQGRNLMTLSAEDMRKVRGAQIGFVFQEPMTALDPVYTVGAQIVESLRTHEVMPRAAARARAVELLRAVRMPSPETRIDSYPHQLSGGMRQRVLIAIAIASKPALLIADEPTTALDVTIQAEILELLRDMQQSLGLSMLLITHDLGVLAQTADRVAVMYAGRIVEQGTVRQILGSPHHPYTRGLIAATPAGQPGHRLHQIAGIVPSLEHRPAGCAFHPRCPERFEPCDSVVPADRVADDGRRIRCHLYDVQS